MVEVPLLGTDDVREVVPFVGLTGVEELLVTGTLLVLLCEDVDTGGE